MAGQEATTDRTLARRQPQGRRLADMLGGAALLLLGDRAHGGLTERVQRRIAQQQQASEIIIGWMQAAAVLLLGVVYAFAPKAFPPDVGFEPIPWTLGAYGLFTALRLYLAYRHRLPGWFVGVSSVVDVAVLMTTIWSFHLQYQAPPALYLKAPTLMYIFILIALRTLRFEPRYVLITGAAGAVGWTILFVYALSGWAEHAPSFTSSYTEYVTSYQILLGAEVDKILSIVIVTSILALAILRARRLLASAVAEEVAASDLAKFVPPEVAEQLRRNESAPRTGQGLRREAAILSVDLRGFTALSHRMEPTGLIGLLGEYQARFVPVIERHGGKVDKYLGDGILASFGAVDQRPAFAADMCRALEELLSEAERWRRDRALKGQDTPVVGMAGAAGAVVFGTVGHETRLEYTVIGEVVNLAAKLEKLTKAEDVGGLVTRGAFTLAATQGYMPLRPVEQRPGRRLEGLDDAIDLVAFSRR